MNDQREDDDQKVWWKSLKPGDRIVRVLLPGDEGYKEALAEWEKENQPPPSPPPASGPA